MSDNATFFSNTLQPVATLKAYAPMGVKFWQNQETALKDLKEFADGWFARRHEGLQAALEAAVRYIAAELGPKGIRVHAISPGPLATRAASGIPEFDELMDKAQSKAPSRSLVSIDDVGNATAFLALDGAKLITGSVLYIDGGYHIID